MTTAHRPTWKAAVGRANQGGWSAGGAVSTAVSALEAPGQLSLKALRKPIDKKKALRESLLALREAEARSSSATTGAHLPKRTVDTAIEERAQRRLLKQTAEVDVAAIRARYDDSDVEDDGGDDVGDDDRNHHDSKRKGTDPTNTHNDDDKDDDSDGTDLDDSDDDDDDDDDDDEDDEAALQAELAKLKAERELQKQRLMAEQAALEQRQDESAALTGNPLLSTSSPASLSSSKRQRRWNDDVVFRNQSKGEPQIKKRFINDTVRNDFHKRFLNKFIR